VNLFMRRKNRPDPLAAALSRSTSCSVRLLAELVENGKKARPLLMTSPLGGYHSALAAGDLVAAAMDMSKRRPRLMDLRRNAQENDINLMENTMVRPVDIFVPGESLTNDGDKFQNWINELVTSAPLAVLLCGGVLDPRHWSEDPLAWVRFSPRVILVCGEGEHTEAQVAQAGDRLRRAGLELVGSVLVTGRRGITGPNLARVLLARTDLTTDRDEQKNHEYTQPDNGQKSGTVVDGDPVWERNVNTETGGSLPEEIDGDNIPENSKHGTRKGRSKVSWFTTAASLALIAIASVYYFQFFRIAPEESFASAGDVANSSSADIPTTDMSATVSPVKDIVVFSDEYVVPDSMRENDTQTVELATKPTDQVIKSVVAVTKPAAEMEESVPEPTARFKPETEKVSSHPEFQMAPYLIPVGEQGYALHIYSFADSVDAMQQINELELLGFQTEWRAVEVSGKGRYFRVFLGSFSSKSSAREAKNGLLKKLHQDWARVVRF